MVKSIKSKNLINKNLITYIGQSCAMVSDFFVAFNIIVRNKSPPFQQLSFKKLIVGGLKWKRIMKK